MSAPMSMPTQNPPNPFPAWRLKSGIKNATDAQLEVAEESCEWWGWISAGILLVGLVAEAFHAGFDPPHASFWGRWGPLLADCLVVIGVAGEVQFARMGSRRQGELTQRAKKQLGEANKRAAEANLKAQEAELALARFRSLRRDDLKGRTGPIIERLKLFPGTQFDCGLGQSGEQADFWWDLQPALRAAGWDHVPWKGAGFFVMQGDRPLSGSVSATNVEIHIHPQSRERLLPAVLELVAALSEAGITAADAGFNTNSENVNAIHILIGDKR